MRQTKKIFTTSERRLALVAAIVVVAISTFGMTLGSGFVTSTGTGDRAAYGFSDLPGVADARPLATS